jgi:hypothetical protein
MEATEGDSGAPKATFLTRIQSLPLSQKISIGVGIGLGLFFVASSGESVGR